MKTWSFLTKIFICGYELYESNPPNRVLRIIPEGKHMQSRPPRTEFVHPSVRPPLSLRSTLFVWTVREVDRSWCGRSIWSPASVSLIRWKWQGQRRTSTEICRPNRCPRTFSSYSWLWDVLSCGHLERTSWQRSERCFEWTQVNELSQSPDSIFSKNRIFKNSKMRKIIQEGMFPIFNTVGLSLLYSCHRQLFQTCSSIPINSTPLKQNLSPSRPSHKKLLVQI